MFAVFVISALGGASRVLGFLRDQMVSVRFGMAADFDAYTIGSTAPALLTAALIAPLAAACVPVISSLIATEGREAAEAFAKRATLVMSIVAGVLSIVGMVTIQSFLSKVAPDFALPVRQEAYVSAAIGYLVVPFSVAVAVMKSLMDSRRKFNVSSSQPIVLNICIIAALVVARVPRVTVLAAAAASGIFIHFVWQWHVTRQEWKSAIVPVPSRAWMMLLKLSLPVLLGAIISQFNVVVDRHYASTVTGSVGALNLADRIRQIPFGILIAGIYAISFPLLSDLAARADHVTFKAQLERFLRLTAITLIPCGLLLSFLGEPFVRLVFQHGRFDQIATNLTSSALLAYAPGVLGMGISQILMSALFAHGRTALALTIATGANLMNVGLDALLVHPLGHVGVALANTIAVSLQAVVLSLALPAHSRAVPSSRGIAPIGLATLLSTILLIAGRWLAPGGTASIVFLYWTGISILASTAYALTLVSLGVPEVRDLLQLVGSRLRITRRVTAERGGSER